MLGIVKATVTTNSLEDSLRRVLIKSPGIWSGDVQALTICGDCYNVGDVVAVDVSNGYNNPIILGKLLDNSSETNASTGGAVVFESKSNGYSVLSTKGPLSKLENSKDMFIEVDDFIKLNGDSYTSVRYEPLKELLNKMLRALARTTVQGAPLSTSPLFESMRNELEGFKSKTVKLK